MKNLFLMAFLFVSLGACSSNDGGSGSNPKPGKELGTFHPGPYKDPATGKHCNAPGGYCEDDKSCHSSPSKCHKR